MSCFYLFIYLFFILAPSKAPLPPELVSAKATSATIRWGYDTEEPVQSYIVQYRLKCSAGSYKKMTATKEMEYTIHGLLSYTEYVVRVAVVNAVGQGEPSPDLTFTTAQTGIS